MFMFFAGCVSGISSADENSCSADETGSAPYIVIDGDPGCDDAFVYFLAAKVLTEPDLYIASIGNAPRILTAANLAVMDCYLDLKGRTALGADRTMRGLDARYDGFNGDDALGGVSDVLAEACGFDAAEYRFDYQNVDEIADELMLHSTIIYVSTGPAITLAKLLIKKPELKNHISKIILMGGGLTISNTPCDTEYNFMNDTAALSVILRSGIPVVIFPLDFTVPLYLSEEDIAEFKDTGAYPEMTMILEYLSSVSGNGNYHIAGSANAGYSIPYPLPDNAVVLHDTFPILYLHNPEMFSLTEKKILVDTLLPSCGKILVRDTGYPVYVAEAVTDRDYLKNLLLSAYAS